MGRIVHWDNSGKGKGYSDSEVALAGGLLVVFGAFLGQVGKTSWAYFKLKRQMKKKMEEDKEALRQKILKEIFRS